MNSRFRPAAAALLLCAAAPAHSTTTVWKIHGKSAYADTPPHLRLHNIQIFYPRTGKLSAVIRAKPRKPVKKNADAETAYAPSWHMSAPPDDAAAPPGQAARAVAEAEPVSPAEQQRRDMCQAAQDAWQKAAAAQSSEAAQYEAEVVRHCIAA